MMRRLLLLLFLAAPVAAQAEEIVADLSQNRISITAAFDGSEILVFGAIKRSAARPDGPPPGIVVTIAGPLRPVTVRRKSRVLGIWANTSAVEVDLAPSFYAVTTSGPVERVLRQTDDLRHSIMPRRAIRSVGAPDDVTDAFAYTEALIRIRSENGLYSIDEGGVRLLEDTLFSTSVALPSNLVEGVYAVRVFLTREGRVSTHFTTIIDVQKVGLERFLHTLAYERPLVYGLMSLAIAIAAGWGASAAFRYLRS